MIKISPDVELLNIIGVGSYGDVYIGINSETNEKYAIKKITKKQLKSEIVYQYFNNEIFILKHLNHPNIVKFKRLTEYGSNFYLLTEYCNGGNLGQAMKYYFEKYNKPIPEDISRYFIKKILEGIVYLNKNSLIHRDIKSNNILLNYENEDDLITNNFLNAKIKIIDFGFARYLEENELAGSLVGTPMYMEPSILKTYVNSTNKIVKGFYDQKVDVWSLGILTYELLIGIFPFIAQDIQGLFYNVEQRNFNIPENRNIKLSEAAIQFIDRVLNIDINIRPLPEELMNDPWMTGNYDKNKLYIMKNDEEIKSINKKNKFKNFWNIENKTNSLEIIGLSYIDPRINKFSNNIRNWNKNKVIYSKNKKNKDYKKVISHNKVTKRYNTVSNRFINYKEDEDEYGVPELNYISDYSKNKINNISQISRQSEKTTTDSKKSDNMYNTKILHSFKNNSSKLNSLKWFNGKLKLKFENNIFKNNIYKKLIRLTESNDEIKIKNNGKDINIQPKTVRVKVLKLKVPTFGNKKIKLIKKFYQHKSNESEGNINKYFKKDFK